MASQLLEIPTGLRTLGLEQALKVARAGGNNHELLSEFFTLAGLALTY